MINNFGRIALCGATASYANFKERSGINALNIVSRRVYVKGFNFAEYADRGEEALEFYAKHIENKKIKFYIKTYKGLENF